MPGTKAKPFCRSLPHWHPSWCRIFEASSIFAAFPLNPGSLQRITPAYQCCLTSLASQPDRHQDLVSATASPYGNEMAWRLLRSFQVMTTCLHILAKRELHRSRQVRYTCWLPGIYTMAHIHILFSGGRRAKNLAASTLHAFDIRPEALNT